MDLISLMIVLAVIGVCWWMIVTYIPMPDPMKSVITVVAVIALCIVLLNLTGVGNIHIGSLHQS